MIDDRHLEALVSEAWELAQTGSPYLEDACEAIVDAWDRRVLAEYERRQERSARLRRVLRETDPERIPRGTTV
jgi:hypothetical protein